jgi:hypothetical protein
VSVQVYLEVGTKRVFASAIGWPGWTRQGKDEKAALEALAAYADRFAPVARLARLTFQREVDFKVVDRVKGDATTDFGAPHMPTRGDWEKLSAADAGRIAALLTASWKTFDATAAKAPSELRKGPRGGGRDRDKIVEHVLGAESAYVPKIGLRLRQPAAGDATAIKAFRDAILATVKATAGKKPDGEGQWPVPYAARRIAWHALDHAWEIEDRS